MGCILSSLSTLWFFLFQNTIHSFNLYLLSLHDMPDAVPHVGGAAEIK